MRANPHVIFVVAAVVAVAGCGTTEESGSVGDTLTANGLEVTVSQVDTSVPLPKSDVTGLSLPSPGSKLIGVQARVCSNHGGAIGPYDFGIETTGGEQGELKFPARNYDSPFDSFSGGCGDGWVVFEIPASSDPGRVTFGFEDTGTAYQRQTQVDAKFSWSVSS